MLDAVIFDVDGTLVDTVDLHAGSWQRALAHFGYQHKVAEIRAQIGKGGDQLLPVFLSEDQVERDGKAIETYRKDLFAREYMARVRCFTDVRTLMQRLLGDGRKLALASSAKGDELQRYKKVAEIADLPFAETSSDDAERSKPHPDIFEAALRRLKLPPERCMVVGDTPYDAIAAVKAGMRVTGVLCGGFTEAELRSAGCMAVYVGPADLVARYDEWMALARG